MDLIINAAVWFSIAIVFISTVITKAAAERIMLDATSNISITSAPSLEMNSGRSHDSIGEAYACMQINVLRSTLLRNLQLESVPPFAGTEE
ncbi:unnamed protein product [Urochloa decumbens]|uniref:Uncharacterized protein n=1 Tax=Urochloa decumbens TaxID=240449 RepID=A0ABC9APA1_9POAL